MFAVFDDHSESLFDTHRHRRTKHPLIIATERLFHPVFSAKQPRIALGATADQNAIDSGLAHAPVGITQILNIAVSDNQHA